MDYRKLDYVIHIFYFLGIVFLFYVTKANLKKRYQNIKYLNLKAAGIILLIVIPLILCFLLLIAWYVLKDQPF